MPTLSITPSPKKYMPITQTIYPCALVFPRCSFAVLSGVANPQSWGREGRWGSGMVPFEWALVSSYKPSMVTFPLSLRVSETLPLLFSSTPLFPYHTSSLPKISPCSPGSRWIAFSLQRANVLGYLSVQLVSKISNLCDHNPVHQRHRQTDIRTDGRTTCDRKTALCTQVHCAVKTNDDKLRRETQR